MKPRQICNIPRSSNRRASGFTALETAIVFIATILVGTLASFTLLGVSFRTTDEGKAGAQSAVENAASPLSIRGGMLTTRGSVDVDGNNAINLNGADRQAVVKLTFVVGSPASGMPVDLTPPFTLDSTGVDPDASGLSYSTLFGFTSRDFQMTDTSWTVTFPGTDNGDYMLDVGERAEITVWLQRYDTLNDHYEVGAGATDAFVDTVGELLIANREFSIEALSRGSSVLHLERNLPLELAASDMLE